MTHMGRERGSRTRYLPCSYCFNQLEHRHAVGHGKGNETGIYQSSAQHPLIISLLCVSCFRTAHPLTAVHTEKAGGMPKNILRKVEFVYQKLGSCDWWFYLTKYFVSVIFVDFYPFKTVVLRPQALIAELEETHKAANSIRVWQEYKKTLPCQPFNLNHLSIGEFLSPLAASK